MSSNKTIFQKYPQPVKGAEFRRYWKKFLSEMTTRDNFNETHLENIRILCKLYVEYDRMTKTLDEVYEREGSYTVLNEGRYGIQFKLHPEFSERKNILAEIRQYSKMLYMAPDKKGDNSGEDENEWG